MVKPVWILYKNGNVDRFSRSDWLVENDARSYRYSLDYLWVDKDNPTPWIYVTPRPSLCLDEDNPNCDWLPIQEADVPKYIKLLLLLHK